MFTCKDVDLLIAEKLDIWSIARLSTVNKYWNTLLKAEPLWRKKTLELIPLSFSSLNKERAEKKSWKEYFVELYEAWNNPDYVYRTFRALMEERNDIFYLIFTKRKLDPNHRFILRIIELYQEDNYLGNDLNCYYALEKQIDGPWSFSPIKIVIRKNNLQLWEFLKSNYTLALNDDLFYECIPDFSSFSSSLETRKENDLSILKDLLDMGVEVPSRILIFCLGRNNLEAMKILLEYSYPEIVRNAVLEIFYLSQDRDIESLYVSHEYFQLGKKHAAFRYFLAYERVAIMLHDNLAYINTNPILKKIIQ